MVAYLVAGASLAIWFGQNQGDPYLERDFPCASFDLLPVAKKKLEALGPKFALVPPATRAKRGPPPRTERDRLTCRGAARAADLPVGSWAGALFHVPIARFDHDSYRMLRILYALSALMLCLGTPSVIWGAVACLAVPETNSAHERYAAWAEQTSRLNRLLYITAGFMIAGLLFTNARMMWPAYSLHPDDLKPFSAHVGSLILYLGVTNSLLIASYYIPVASFLSRARPQPSSPADASPRHPDIQKDRDEPDSWGAFRTAATIMSPAIVALIGEMVKFAG